MFHVCVSSTNFKLDNLPSEKSRIPSVQQIFQKMNLSDSSCKLYKVPLHGELHRVVVRLGQTMCMINTIYIILSVSYSPVSP